LQDYRGATLQSYPWRDIENVIINVGPLSCLGDFAFVGAMARFAEQPQTTTYGRPSYRKEWPFTERMRPKHRFFHGRTKIEWFPDEHQGGTAVFSAYGVSRWRKTPRWEIWVPLSDILERVKQLMGVRYDRR
jgi:hypothetical protein